MYHRPKAQERIFLFLDLERSTHVAERLGNAQYFKLLRRFAEQLTEPVLETGGEIYQYAGGEGVVTWPMKAGVHAGSCVRRFFVIRAAVERDRVRYEDTFGVVPSRSRRRAPRRHGGPRASGQVRRRVRPPSAW